MLRRALIFLLATLPASASIKLQVIQGRPVVDGVFVNGHGPYRFLVDTATTSNHIEPDLADSIGLEATYRIELTSSVGKKIAFGSSGIEVALGDMKADRQSFLFAGMEVVHQLSRGIQGILGQDFLSRFDYLIDLRARHLEFGKQERAGQRASFRLQNGRAAVSTSLGDLLLDSGTDILILFGVEPEGGDGGLVKTLAGSQIVGMAYRNLVIGGRRVWSGRAVTMPNPAESGVSGLMPLSLFHTVYICNSEGYAVFQ